MIRNSAKQLGSLTRLEVVKKMYFHVCAYQEQLTEVDNQELHLIMSSQPYFLCTLFCVGCFMYYVSFEISYCT